MNLADGVCEACRVDAPRVTAEESGALLQELSNWEIESPEGIDILVREFSFHNFVAALAFTNQVGALAEENNHHPALITEWGKVTVEWWTHKINGLHKNDFVMAAKTDQLYLAQLER